MSWLGDVWEKVIRVPGKYLGQAVYDQFGSSPEATQWILNSPTINKLADIDEQNSRYMENVQPIRAILNGITGTASSIPVAINEAADNFAPQNGEGVANNIVCSVAGALAGGIGGMLFGFPTAMLGAVGGGAAGYMYGDYVMRDVLNFDLEKTWTQYAAGAVSGTMSTGMSLMGSLASWVAPGMFGPQYAFE